MCCRGCKVIANVGHGDGQLGMRGGWRGEQRGGISGCRKLLEGRWGMNQRRRRCVWWTWERRELRTTCPRAERSLESKNQMVTLLIWAAAEDFQHQHAQKGGWGCGGAFWAAWSCLCTVTLQTVSASWQKFVTSHYQPTKTISICLCASDAAKPMKTDRKRILGGSSTSKGVQKLGFPAYPTSVCPVKCEVNQCEVFRHSNSIWAAGPGQTPWVTCKCLLFFLFNSFSTHFSGLKSSQSYAFI